MWAYFASFEIEKVNDPHGTYKWCMVRELKKE